MLLWLLAWLMGVGLACVVAMVLDGIVEEDERPSGLFKLGCVVLWPAFFVVLGAAGLLDRVECAAGGDS